MSISLKRNANRAIDCVEQAIKSIFKLKYLVSRRIPWSLGYTDYKYDFVGKLIGSRELNVFLSDTLPKGYGYRMDERFVEYPWFFSRIKKDEKILLDAGSVLNHRQILSSKKLTDKELYITTLFYEGRPKILPSPSYVYEDIRSMSFKDSFFDAICCLSTLEHVGLDNAKLYTPEDTARENDKHSHLRAISEMHRVLKPSGTLYLTLPFGTYKNHGWFQVFDSGMVGEIINIFDPSIVAATYFRYANDQWNFSNEESCQDGYCFDIHETKQYEPDYLAFARCVVCLELTKKSL